MNDEQETQHQENEQSESQMPLPGGRLRAAREAAGLSQSEVAAQLRIQERMVEALELDDYDSFPSATFVSGYLRSYARLLELPEEEYVQPVKQATEPPSIVPTIGEKEQVSSRALPVRLVTYLLAAVVIVSLGMWWFAQGEKTQLESEAAQEEPAMNVAGDNGLNVPQEGELADGAAVEPSLAAETQVEQNDTEQPAPAAADGEAGSETTATHSSPEDEVEQDEATTPPPLTEATLKSSLVLKYEKDSWTEISDSAGRRLAYGLIKAGQTLELEGEAPFQVSLGYAPGVEVFYNGEFFDHSPFTRRDLARFRVGRAEHNLPGPR